MKRFISASICVCMLLSLLFVCTSCGGEKADYTVGILQQLEHPALDQANRGFTEELTRLMTAAGKTVAFNNQNANGDASTLSTISDALIAKKSDLLLSIATTASQTLLSKDADAKIPMLFTAVTDPVDAGLVASMEQPGGYATGTSDLNPVAQQFELITKLVPGVKKIGIIYTTSEDNSVIQKNLLAAACADAGVTLVEKGISDATDIGTAINSMKAENIEALYFPTDNLLANSAAAIHTYNKETLHLPVVCGEESMNNACGVATYSVNYYNLGAQTAQIAFDILVNGKKPADIPVQYYSRASELIISEKNAADIGFTIPAEVLALKDAQ